MASTATVATRPRARRLAATAPARSICAISQPPKISPFGLASAGMAKLRSAGSRPAGGLSSVTAFPLRRFDHEDTKDTKAFLPRRLRRAISGRRAAVLTRSLRDLRAFVVDLFGTRDPIPGVYRQRGIQHPACGAAANVPILRPCPTF